MNSITIKIEPFAPQYQTGVDKMLDAISNEYAESFFHQHAKKMEEVYFLPERSYWVALADGIVIGSVGIITINGYAVLKSLFVNKKFRGNGWLVADRLMRSAIDKAKQMNCMHIYLGTMEQFKAAQRFYEKHGYSRVQINELPLDYSHNVLDTVFYSLQLD